MILAVEDHKSVIPAHFCARTCNRVLFWKTVNQCGGQQVHLFSEFANLRYVEQEALLAWLVPSCAQPR